MKKKTVYKNVTIVNINSERGDQKFHFDDKDITFTLPETKTLPICFLDYYGDEDGVEVGKAINIRREKDRVVADLVFDVSIEIDDAYDVMISYSLKGDIYDDGVVLRVGGHECELLRVLVYENEKKRDDYDVYEREFESDKRLSSYEYTTEDTE